MVLGVLFSIESKGVCITAQIVERVVECCKNVTCSAKDMNEKVPNIIQVRPATATHR